MLESRGWEVVLGHFCGVEGLWGLRGCPVEWRGLLGDSWVVVVGPRDGRALMGDGKHVWDAEGC